MGLNVINYALQVKGDKSTASGFDHAIRTGDNTFSIYFIDGSTVDLTIPLSKDGKDAVDITDVKDIGNGKFTLVLSDGSETSAVQTVKGEKGDKGDKLTFNDLTDEEKAFLKGDSGFSPTITENENNTDKIYKLDVTTADGTFTTPNLKGADGQGGTGGSGEENIIDSISVNGVNVAPDENKNVDITVPNIYVGDTEPIDDNIEVWFNPNGESSSIEGTAETITYTNANYPSYTNVDLALDALFSKVYYVKPTCSLSATPRGGTFEMGTVISAPITFTWTTNKDITSQTLTGCTLANASVRTATYNTNVTSDKTFTLSVSDGENSASSSVSYKFLNNIFWGSAAAAETYDSAFIRALSNKKLASAIKGTYSFNIANGEYGFWAVPSNMTISSVWIGGFEVTVDDLGTVSYTNAQGYTRDYKLYKTGKASLGAISAEIK